MIKRQISMGISLLSLTSIGLLMTNDENIGLIALLKRLPRFWLVFLLIAFILITLAIGYAWWRLPAVVGKFAMIILMTIFIGIIIWALLQSDQRKTLHLIISASIGLITAATSLLGLHQQTSLEWK
ncbi:hypothetical protein [Lapidilactobacillus luobeiensis]|uniref:hypothetical protein n=1 Tax=Lapidilactobacillus luobeiensis TaxID=2950371 RepID=UPI0021C34873|nr:hypothetical protein [Lapidilactobacillus luobeiensis]